MRSWPVVLVLAACAPIAPPASPPSPASSLPAPPPPSPIATLPSRSSPAPAPDAVDAPPQGALEHAMRNCPTAVAGAATTATNTASGVDLMVTATEPASQRRILELSAMHEQLGDPDGSAMRHTGRHGGPGSVGHCPVIHTATTVTFTRIRKGAVIHVRALMPDDVPRVQALVADRLAHLASR